MATEPKPAAAPVAVANKSGKALLTIIIVVILAAGGAAVWLVRRTASAAQTKTSTPAASAIKAVLHLDNFIVNISSTDGSDGYLRVGIDLGLGKEIRDGGEGNQAPPYTPRLRDAILSVLATRHVDELLTSEGKEKLKQDLLKAIMEKIPDIDCREVYFTEFLVQH